MRASARSTAWVAISSCLTTGVGVAVAQPQVAPGVKISQVWGGGDSGSPGGPKSDVVELFNSSNSPVTFNPVSGPKWTLQYQRNANGTGTWQTLALVGTIPAHKYFLVRLDNPTGTETVLPTPDQTATLTDALSATRAKIALVQGPLNTSAAALSTTNSQPSFPLVVPSGYTVVDLLGSGNGGGFPCDASAPGTLCANTREDAQAIGILNNAPAGSVTQAAAVWVRRKCAGLSDTDNNSLDWEQCGPGIAVAATWHNSASPANNGLDATPSAAPECVGPGESIAFLIASNSSCGTPTSATANLTPIGGSASQVMNNLGLGNFDLNTTVGGAVTPGLKTIIFTISDGTFSTNVNLQIMVTRANDDCAGATLLTGPGPYAWSNVGSCTDTVGQDFTACGMTGLIYSDVWLRWTAPSTGQFTISTVGSVGAVQPGNKFDARLAVYPDGCPPGTPIACNDDAPIPDGPASRTSFSAVSGTTYLIQVGANDALTYTSQGVLTITLGDSGACCLNNFAGCTIVASSLNCDSSVGLFRGPGSVCATALCPEPLGQCCLGTGACVANTQGVCNVSGGVSWTIGGLDVNNECDGTQTCPAGGSCCTPGGVCTSTIQSLCAVENTWTSGGICVPNPCSQPVGACCIDNGAGTIVCAQTQSTGCLGNFLGLNIPCLPDPCNVPAGVCCRGTTCNTSVTQANCTAPSAGIGAFYAAGGLGNTCNVLNNRAAPCCYPDFNKSAGVTAQDIFDFLAAWFAGSPYARYAGDGTGGAPTAQSIFDFLAAWFAGPCPAYP